MAQQDYSLVKLFFNGASVTQLTKVTRMMDAQNQPIMLLNEGLGGWSPGSGISSVEWEAPIPLGGTEFDYEGIAHRREYVDLQVFVGSRSVASRGKIQTVQSEGSAGAPSSCSIKWEGAFEPTE
jgi:hypothetical protein